MSECHSMLDAEFGWGTWEQFSGGKDRDSELGLGMTPLTMLIVTRPTWRKDDVKTGVT